MADKKALVLLSGGLDSAVAAAYMMAKGCEVAGGVFVNRGQSNYKREREAAEKVSQRLQVPLYASEFSVPDLGALVTEETRKKYGVPARNLILGTLALPYVQALGCDLLILGNIASDSFPDCNREFRTKFSAVASHVLGRTVEVIAPLADWEGWDKTGEIVFAHKNGLDALFSLTWTCWGGGKLPCGTCEACLVRKEGFAKAGLTDPTVYAGGTS